jgi:hypothetical protein
MHRSTLTLATILICLMTSVAQQAKPPAADSTASRTIAPADRPSKEQLVRLFEVMRIRSQMDEMLKMVPAALQQQLQNEEENVEPNHPVGAGELTPEQKAAEQKVTQKYIELSTSLYPTDEMVNDMVEVYQRHLSRADVDGIIAFYRSTPGQHILDAQPLMAKEVMPAVTRKLESRNKELLDRYRKELDQVLGPPKIPPAATAPSS